MKIEKDLAFMSEQPIKINVGKTLAEKMPRYAKYIPGFVVGWLSRLICQDELNKLLADNHGKSGTEFAQALLHDLDIGIKTEGGENLPDGTGKHIFVCNHPLGGLDGIALIALLGKSYGDKLKVIVNDILMQVKPFSDVFLPINKHGSQSHAAASAINDALDSDCQILVFPAGLCSRKQKDGSVSDLSWQKSFIRQSIDYRRDVIPLYFDGHNSHFFYSFAKLRNLLGIKLNIEMILLPGEIFKNKGKTFTVHCGKPIPWQSFSSDSPLSKQAQDVKQIVYRLKDNH